jgi:hypothetical protein
MRARWPDPTAGGFLPDGSSLSSLLFANASSMACPTAGELLPDGGLPFRLLLANAALHRNRQPVSFSLLVLPPASIC